jgi:hypothetical protein
LQALISLENMIKLNITEILNLQKQLFSNTDKAWENIKQASFSWKSLYWYYVIPLVFLSTIAVAFFTIRHLDIEFFSINQVFFFTFSGSIAAIYVSGHLLSSIAPRFNGALTLDESISYISFGYSPVFLASIISSMHEILQIVNIAAAVFMVFVFYKGTGRMVNIPAQQQLGFTIVSLMILFITRLMLSAVFAIFAGMFPF